MMTMGMPEIRSRLDEYIALGKGDDPEEVEIERGVWLAAHPGPIVMRRCWHCRRPQVPLQLTWDHVWDEVAAGRAIPSQLDITCDDCAGKER